MHLAEYHPRQIDFSHGEGCFLFDKKGKKYIDFLAGWCVCNAGSGRKEIMEALAHAVWRGIYVAPLFHQEEWEIYARKLAAVAPNKKLKKVFRSTSGSEAVEFALKCARAATGKPAIVAIDGVYHGHTYGAASAGNACSRDMAPCAPGFLKLPMPDAYRGVTGGEVVLQFERLAKSRQDIAAFISEPVWTNAGCIIPPPNFYPAIEKICRKNGILFIMDEVATGFGRCGKLFASDLWGVKPDIMCLGKGITSGYGTMGATLVTEEIFERSAGVPHYSTFGWNLFDLAAANANLDLIIRDGLADNARRLHEYFLKSLKQFEELSSVGEVRGIGMCFGIEIVKDKKTKRPDFAKSQAIQDACEKRGLLIETAHHNLFITPPLSITKEIIDAGVGILKAVLA
jgi:4-aminobutyrate aminotransferase-like enzyme